MTCIVQGFKTKKELKERVALLNDHAGTYYTKDFYIENPSPFPAGKFEFAGTASELPDGKEVVVTNHPKRSWFAQVGRKGGKLYVK